jgi:hypothetical protein
MKEKEKEKHKGQRSVVGAHLWNQGKRGKEK